MFLKKERKEDELFLRHVQEACTFQEADLWKMKGCICVHVFFTAMPAKCQGQVTRRTASSGYLRIHVTGMGVGDRERYCLLFGGFHCFAFCFVYVLLLLPS